MTPGSALSANEQAALTTYFSDDLELFLAFRAACLEQWGADVAAGDAASQRHDWSALCRLAHSLKSVLQTLGHDDLSALARQAEYAAKQPDPAAALGHWQALRAGLQQRFALSIR